MNYYHYIRGCSLAPLVKLHLYAKTSYQPVLLSVHASHFGVILLTLISILFLCEPRAVIGAYNSSADAYYNYVGLRGLALQTTPSLSPTLILPEGGSNQ